MIWIGPFKRRTTKRLSYISLFKELARRRQLSMKAAYVDSGASRPGLEAWPYYLATVWIWTKLLEPPQDSHHYRSTRFVWGINEAAHKIYSNVWRIVSAQCILATAVAVLVQFIILFSLYCYQGFFETILFTIILVMFLFVCITQIFYFSQLYASLVDGAIKLQTPKSALS